MRFLCTVTTELNIAGQLYSFIKEINILKYINSHFLLPILKLPLWIIPIQRINNSHCQSYHYRRDSYVIRKDIELIIYQDWNYKRTWMNYRSDPFQDVLFLHYRQCIKWSYKCRSTVNIIFCFPFSVSVDFIYQPYTFLIPL